MLLSSCTKEGSFTQKHRLRLWQIHQVFPWCYFLQALGLSFDFEQGHSGLICFMWLIARCVYASWKLLHSDWFKSHQSWHRALPNELKSLTIWEGTSLSFINLCGAVHFKLCSAEKNAPSTMTVFLGAISPHMNCIWANAVESRYILAK